MTSQAQRRSFLRGLGGLGLSSGLWLAIARTPAAPGQGYALGGADGEHLLHFRDQGDIFIKISAATGSDNLAVGTQQVKRGSGIPTHRHLSMDEAFYILEGGGTVVLNDVRHRFEKNGSIFIPKNCWHSFENPDRELLLLWIVTPAGLDGFFRDTCNPPGLPPKQLTREQVKQIALNYGTEFQ
jgi:mannose-6-phosphate isomerase-like protein (cupin superfamily)